MDENTKILLGEAIDIEKWVEDSKSSFKPPVCNKLMYGAGQLKVMFVGGPNCRKDYHIEEGEEFFYMLKGDMCLKIMEKGKPKDVHIREGEVFALPSRIPHSPQRKENTVGVDFGRGFPQKITHIHPKEWPIKDRGFRSKSFKMKRNGKTDYPMRGKRKQSQKKKWNVRAWEALDNAGVLLWRSTAMNMDLRRKDVYSSAEEVIERERALDEMDGLRYYCEDGFTPLFEKWFHCEDLVKDLPPVIKEYMASEQYKTGKPVPGTITENPPLKLDTITEVHQPFNLHDWIDKNKATILSSGMKEIFSEGEFKITAYGAGSFESENSGETWLWQLEGTSHVKVGEEVRTLKNGEVILIPANMKYSVEREANSVGLTVNMDPMAAKSK